MFRKNKKWIVGTPWNCQPSTKGASRAFKKPMEGMDGHQHYNPVLISVSQFQDDL
jgi:hypothetical protein